MNAKSFRTYDGRHVSLYVPCFNAQDCIGDCLKGILAQTEKPASILLIDDASPVPLESLPCVQEAVAASGGAASVLRLETNIGLAPSRNKALELCKTPLLASLDADVVAEPDWLEKLLKAFNAGDAAGVGGRLDELRQDTLGDRWRAVHMAQHWGDAPLSNPRFLYGANNLFDATALRRAGGYISSLRSNYEDMSASEKLLSMGCKLLYEPAARCGHLRRDTEESILKGFWKWFHAKGVLQGDFKSPEGLLRRVDQVNFGIHRYRFDLDRKAGRQELLRLDLLIPWVFCAMDLDFAKKSAAFSVPAFPDEELAKALPEEHRTLLMKIVPKPAKPSSSEAWHAEYLGKFIECLKSFGWTADRDSLRA